MTRKVRDPDFGEFELSPAPSDAELARLREEMLANVRKRRIWPSGSVTRCPSCGAKAFAGRDDLVQPVARPGGVVVFRRLRGARCGACDAQRLEPAEMLAIEEEAGLGIVGDYEAKVTRIGSGSMGTYWPKDVVRVLRLEPGAKAYIRVLDRETVLVRFGKGDGAAPRKRKPAKTG